MIFILYVTALKENYCTFLLHHIYFTAVTFYFTDQYFTYINYDQLLLCLNLQFYIIASSSLIVEE